MTIKAKIIADLRVTPSTPDATAQRIGISTQAAEIQMKRMEAEGLLKSRPVMDGALTVYRLTPSDQ